MMELAKYPFAEKYCWLNDKYGVSWQLMLGKHDPKLRISLMFVGGNNGRAQEAIDYYTKTFNGKEVFVAKYEKGAPDTEGNIMHAVFTMNGQEFIIMESSLPHEFQFNEGNSLVIYCKDQREIDHYWNTLVGDGGQESMCGWLKDKFNLNWQIVPEELDEMMTSGEVEKTTRMNAVLMQMKKLDIQKLKDAYNEK